MIGRSKIPAPAGDGTPVKKFSNKEFWELFVRIHDTNKDKDKIRDKENLWHG